MAETIVTSAKDEVISTIEISAPPERVFRALTTSGELLRWFTDPGCPARVWEMDARPGGNYLFVTEKGTVVVNGLSEFECHGEIIEVVPPRLLVYTWISNWHQNKTLRTIVRWELTPSADGTQVKVTHSGLAGEDTARKDYSGGWPGVMESLKTFVEK
jgi:uncharacterized protein YndB with AHSA1/START domain